MAIFKCKMCGGNLEIQENISVCECEFCGTEQTLPRLDSDRKTNLYDRANHFRRNNDFDKAMGIYEQILNEDTTDAEAYWSLVLCRYGIEYVDDPSTHKKIPTINRAQRTAVVADEDYKSAIEYAAASQKIIYENEAKTIDEILKGILAISEKEEPFDVFICYKESDENGRRTQDSVLANDLYHQLTQEGFKVFFSRITLEDKLGQEYEPYIFAALDSSKVMVVLGTKPEYFNAVWVKNEWSRYLAKIRAGEKKMLIPAYKDMDPYDLPEEFSHLQAQDMTKLGFMQDLIRGIKKIICADQPQTVTKETVVVQQSGGLGNSNALIKRGNMALEDGEWQKADDFFEEVLNQDAECAEAYLGKFMCKCNCSNIDELTQYYVSKYESAESEELEACQEASSHIDNAVSSYMILNYLSDTEIRKYYAFDRTYKSELSFRKLQKEQVLAELSDEKLLARAKQYATGSTKALIDKMIEDITIILDRRISDAEQDDNESIADIMSSYKTHLNDADSKVKEQYDNVLLLQESDYNSNISDMESAAMISDYVDVMATFLLLHDYKDSESLAEKCKKEIDKLKELERLENKRNESIRRDETNKKAKKKVIISSIVVVVCVAVIIVVTKVVIPNNKYNDAVALMNDGNYRDALDGFEVLGDYKDSNELRVQAELKLLSMAYVGDIVTFGNYYGNTEWEVLVKEDEKILVLSKYALEERPYNTEHTSVIWESCTLRNWLNGIYVTSAFDNNEQALIMSTNVENYDYEKYYTDGENNTTDKVFLLSVDEVEKYFASDSDRKVTLSDGTPVWWWVRFPTHGNTLAAYVDRDGSVYEHGYCVNWTSVDSKDGAVRPAMWISLE